jgi:UDP-N-acetylmuramate--alanine ligase
MNGLDKIRAVHFVGCGGAGMAPLMLIMAQKGITVSGSDLKENSNTRMLKNQGLTVHIGHRADNLPELDNLALVYSSAVKPDNPELLLAKQRHLPVYRRGEYLAELSGLFKCSVAVAGSHGKTTVTAMLAHILKVCDMKPGYMVGGKVNNWVFSADAGNGDIFITEVDESDGTNALIHPSLGLVTNVEDDHCWSVGGEDQLYKNFKTFASQSRKLFYVKSALTDQLFDGHSNACSLDVGELQTYGLSSWGAYQRANAGLAVLAAVDLGISESEALEAVKSFPGVERRMSVHFESENLTVIEDYAHHPTELAVAIKTLREQYPQYNLTVIFQPHRYARLERYFNEFAEELKKPDTVFVVPVFAAWVEKSELDSQALALNSGTNAYYSELEDEAFAKEVFSKLEDGKNLIVVLGAGDVDQVIPALVQQAAAVSASSVVLPS